MSTSVERYTGQRAELLANLVLTRRKDVRLLKFADRDGGQDFIAQLLVPLMDDQVYPCFGIQVQGTDSALPTEEAASKYAKKSEGERAMKGQFLFPVVVFLFSMEGDVGYYSWLMRPQVSKTNGPALSRVSELRMTKITKKAIDDLMREVEQWFEAMAEILGKHASTN